MDDLGRRLRDARQKRGWTLETLSTAAGLSSGFLSQVERGLSTLSIVSLAAICRALDVPIGDLFSASGPLDRATQRVTKRADQLQIHIGDSPIAYRYLSSQLPEAPIVELLVAEFPANTSQAESIHEGRELGYVLDGHLRLRVGGTWDDLVAGDSYRLAPSEPHEYQTGSEPARVLMAITERYIDAPPQTP